MHTFTTKWCFLWHFWAPFKPRTITSVHTNAMHDNVLYKVAVYCLKFSSSLKLGGLWLAVCFCSLAGKQIALKVSPILFLHLSSYIYIYIYAFSRRFYPKRLTVHSGYTFFISMCVPWELNPQPFALLTQCSTTEPQLWCGMNWLPNRIRTIIIKLY